LVTPHVDATLLLVRWKTTPISAVAKALMALETRGVALSGVILNAVDVKDFARASGQSRLYGPMRAYHRRTDHRGHEPSHG
jgi:Mrp family chromosome partitioning ATPase